MNSKTAMKGRQHYQVRWLSPKYGVPELSPAEEVGPRTVR